jgi:mono/diheme cytochrome c family protein
MIVSKTPKVLFMFLALALAGALVVAGCGGSGGTTTSGSTATGEEPNAPAETEEAPVEEEPAEEAPAEEKEEAPTAEAPAEEKEAGGEEGGANAALSEEGKMIFTTTCGSCHTLKEAGTTGEIGPNLDELEPDLATVEHQVINGGGPMPAFGKEGLLSSEEVKAVATYVSSVAGTE